jgi:hypothetical protein
MRLISSVLRTVILLGVVAGLASVVGALVARGRLWSRGSALDDEVDLVAIFDAANLASTSSAFRRATVTAWYGGGTLDLRGATIDPGGARITIRAIFGGYRLLVPPTWRVDLETIAFFGGVGDVRDESLVDPSGPLLTIDGIAVFGGIGIMSAAPDLDEEPATLDLEGVATA